MSKYLGVINNLLSGSYISPFSKKSVSLPIDEIVIERSIENIKFKFTKNLLNKKNLVISGESSFKAFGEKVLKSLRNNNLDFDINILKKYESSQTFATNLSLSSKEYENIIVIGSGSLIDLCKFVSFKNNQNLIVFCSSLTAAATTSTVSLTNDGVKETIKSKIAQSIIIDLDNLRMAPLRLLRSALGDVLCRSTCQIDWLTSHLFLSTEYDETPFALQYEDERLLLDNSYKILEGDYDTLAALSRMTLLNGIAAIIIGSTHAGSMGEHLISHYIDMFMGEKHPGTLHGEQVAVTTLLLSKIQNQIINFSDTLVFKKLNITDNNFRELFGDKIFNQMYEQFKKKYFDGEKLDNLNNLLEKKWPEQKTILKKHLLPTESIEKALKNCGAPTNNVELRIPNNFYNLAIKNSFLLRDRFSYLDVAHYTNTLSDYFIKD